MREDIWYASKGAGQIHACRWTPEGEPKAVMHTLIQDAAKACIPLDQKNRGNTGLRGRHSGRHTGRAATDDNKLVLHFDPPHLILATLMREPPPDLVTAS